MVRNALRLSRVSRLAALLSTSVLAEASALAPAASPTTLLGGFLGAGKTTALTHMLQNRDGLRIAVLVNDVASVNVDAMALRRTSIEVNDGDVEMVELENGCVCCGPGAGQLAPAVASLAAKLNEAGEPAFDHIVVELSGVADPTNVQRNLNGGGVLVERKVALVDANAFPVMYNSVDEMGDRDDLAGANAADADPCAVDRRVVELLLVQIETADVILVNKCDLATDDELKTTLAVCRALNEKATICSTTFGDAKLNELLPPTTGAAAAEVKAKAEAEAAANAQEQCDEPGCTDPSHDHSHSSEHSHSASACDEPGCTDPSHDHSHGHDSACADPTCTDPTHDHAHSHSHDPATVPNSAESMGFTTFVYTARRPFIQRRLVELVRKWPLPSKEVLTLDSVAAPGGETATSAGAADGTKDATFARVLRSKGTCWLDAQHRIAATWSHAGRHFRLTPGGSWWATLPDPIMRACLAPDGMSSESSEAYEAERTHFAGFEGSTGDRRQELVFIGTELDQEAIARALDGCLATDEEMDEYKAVWSVDEERIRDSFGPFRFEVGSKVECAMGANEWARGTVVRQFYREPMWPADRWMPYQVELEDDGDLIWAPADSNECIRKARS
jgi:G3E family GTPase